MLKSLTSQGLVLYNRNFREDDKLVKIFTEQAGKRMFFVKHAGKSKLAPVIQPLTAANLLMKINDDGLSYIEDYQDVVTYHRINEDLFIMAYASYVAALADASLQDNQPDPALKYSGVLCPDHYHQDERRCHLNPNLPFLLDQFQAVRFSELETISLKPDIKKQLRDFIDLLYDEYVGIHLKSKKFIDSLGDWGNILKDKNEE